MFLIVLSLLFKCLIMETRKKNTLFPGNNTLYGAIPNNQKTTNPKSQKAELLAVWRHRKIDKIPRYKLHLQNL